MLNVKAIIVSKMTRHCADKKRAVRNRDKKVRRDVIFKTTEEDGERGQQ